MKPTYLGYDPAKIEVGDKVVSYPNHKTKMRLHGDVTAINGRALHVNYNRTETSNGTMIEKGSGIACIHKECGMYSGYTEVSTSLDIELIIKGTEE